MAVIKIIVEYLEDGNFWNASFCEETGEFQRRNAVNYRSEHKASSLTEVILGGGKGNTFNPEFPSLYNVAALEGIKTSIESRGVEFEYHNTASVDDHFGETEL
tara:strand:- start:655 stop:963 length:309 start_codon:yes stop_codon:yes gene_type:complete